MDNIKRLEDLLEKAPPRPWTMFQHYSLGGLFRKRRHEDEDMLWLLFLALNTSDEMISRIRFLERAHEGLLAALKDKRNRTDE